MVRAFLSKKLRRHWPQIVSLADWSGNHNFPDVEVDSSSPLLDAKTCRAKPHLFNIARGAADPPALLARH